MNGNPVVFSFEGDGLPDGRDTPGVYSDFGFKNNGVRFCFLSMSNKSPLISYGLKSSNA